MNFKFLKPNGFPHAGAWPQILFSIVCASSVVVLVFICVRRICRARFITELHASPIEVAGMARAQVRVARILLPRKIVTGIQVCATVIARHSVETLASA